MKTVEIFWTGGYDSTFRICQLSRMNVIIQPYYLSDKRQSEDNELGAIKIITDKLRNNKETKAVLMDIIYLSKDDRKKDESIKQAYKRLYKQDFMGSQYEWLGVFALEHKGIEMSIHKDDKSIELISKHGRLKTEKGDEGGYYVLDHENSEEDCVTVFGNLHFPLASYTKLEMKEEYEKMGLGDIIDDTWFCFSPINGKPCGKCNPCTYTIEEGMAYRFSPEALRRYRIRKTPPVRALRSVKATVTKMRKKGKSK